jgi:hypothetical protein
VAGANRVVVLADVRRLPRTSAGIDGGNPPQISAVTANPAQTAITIEGASLSASGCTSVTLGTYPNLALTAVTSLAVVATLPAGVLTGSYQLMLTTTSGRLRPLEVVNHPQL